jgi:flagellar biogenesis protein FliO
MTSASVTLAQDELRPTAVLNGELTVTGFPDAPGPNGHDEHDEHDERAAPVTNTARPTAVPSTAGPVPHPIEAAMEAAALAETAPAPADGETVAADAERDARVAAVEQTPLGAPSGMRMPAEGLDSVSADEGGLLGAFDWRKNELLRVAGAMAVVIGLIVLVRVVLSRSGLATAGAGRPSGVVEILGRFPVARGQTLLLIKFARRIVLVQQNGQSMTTLSEVSDQNEVAALLARIEAGSSGRSAAKFRSLLRHFEHEHEGQPDQGGGEIIDLTRPSRPWRGGRARGKLVG